MSGTTAFWITIKIMLIYPWFGLLWCTVDFKYWEGYGPLLVLFFTFFIFLASPVIAILIYWLHVVLKYLPYSDSGKLSWFGFVTFLMCLTIFYCILGGKIAAGDLQHSIPILLAVILAIRGSGKKILAGNAKALAQSSYQYESHDSMA